MISIGANKILISSEHLMNISSRQIVLDEKIMMDLLGANYTMDEIREVIDAQPSGEEVSMVQPLVQ
jgi:hypothetical protein